jgi:cytochrome c553
MNVVFFLLPFLVLGSAVVFIASSGGPAQAREAYLTRGNRTFKVVVTVIYVALGLAVPALVLVNRGQAEGRTGNLKNVHAKGDIEKGKQLFREVCASCHTLAAVNARGVQGPNLDQVGKITPKRIINAIRIGGTGQNRMPSGLLEGKDARDVAAYVTTVAGAEH